VIENLREKLYQLRPTTAIYIGHRYAVPHTVDGYMAGGGYILSRKALTKFKRKQENKECNIGDGGAEDWEMGTCLQNEALFLDGHDIFNQKQFFPTSVEDHLSYGEVNKDYWYVKNLWFNVTQGGLDCCSNSIVCMHYIVPREMFLLNYLIYHVHPFGLHKNDSLALPRKFSLEKIIKLSDIGSYSPNFQPHQFVHHMDDDEKFTI
jgi:glycoprotein-N-acetylgalactosamine 3-beta-galactosyltransferase